MRVFLSIIGLLLAGVGSSPAQYRMEPAGAPPEGLPAAHAAAVEARGFQVFAPDAKLYCQVWPAKTIPAGTGKAEDAVSLPQIPHGALLGIITIPAPASDRRGNSIKPGIYALRYSLYPADGNHMGAAPQRDFAILIPVAEDKPPETLPTYEDLMALSRKTMGTPHPAVLSLYPSSLESLPAFQKEGERDWVLHFKIGSLSLALIVAGKAEG